MSKQTLMQQTVLIDRAAHLKTPVVIFDYEYPVLERLHGGDELDVITVIEEKPVTIDGFDPEQAYHSLKTKFRGDAGQGAMRSVYPSVAAFARQFSAKEK